MSNTELQNIYLGLEGSDGVLLLEGIGRLVIERLLVRDDADLVFHSLIATELNGRSLLLREDETG